jgi:L-lactate dehydrogenase complex protein LldG
MDDPGASRRAILAALRAVPLRDAPLPEHRAPLPAAADLAERFAESLESVGGVCARVPDPSALPAEVSALARRLGASRVVVAALGAGTGSVDLAALRDPHELEGVELAVLPGAFAVAENGAVWIEAGRLPHRGVFVVTQHLALVVPRDQLVPDMHGAYGRLSFEGPGFGLFISGPSKTADIEQALVIGAHGARSCTVFLVG